MYVAATEITAAIPQLPVASAEEDTDDGLYLGYYEGAKEARIYNVEGRGIIVTDGRDEIRADSAEHAAALVGRILGW